MKNDTQVSPEVPVRILKIASCPSISNKSTLSYEVGCINDSEILFRVSSNTGGGFHSKEWVSMSRIQESSNCIPADRTITSYQLLAPIFTGKSANNCAFLFAVLLAEGLVQAASGTVEKRYERIPPDRFQREVNALLESGVNLLDPLIDTKPKSSKSDKPVASENSDAAPEVPIKKSAGKSKKVPMVAS